MNLAAFQAAFPEFANVDTGLIQAKLDQAATCVGADVWGAKYDTGHGYMAAHLLATSPIGQDSRLAADNEKTTYLEHFNRELQAAVCGIRCL